MPVASKSGPLCVVTIDMVCILMLPAADGMKLVALLAKAINVDESYRRLDDGNYGHRVVSRGSPSVEFKLLTGKDLVVGEEAATIKRKPKPAEPLLLEHKGEGL